MSLYKLVHQEQENYELHWTLLNLTEAVTDFANKYNVSVEDVEIVFNGDYECVTFICLREPTAREVAARKRSKRRAAENALIKKQKQEADERALLAKLKKKYGE